MSLLSLKKTPYRGFCNNILSLPSSVSSGVEAMGPSTYFIKEFCFRDGKGSALMGVSILDNGHAATTFTA
eukprot:13343962-Ditylum_brightwellii.AAC.1